MGDFGGHVLFVMVKLSSTMQMLFLARRWQVLDTESSLFRTFASLGAGCHSLTQSRLVSSVVASRSHPELNCCGKALEHWEGQDDCMFDVLATGDLEMAMAGTPTKFRLKGFIDYILRQRGRSKKRTRFTCACLHNKKANNRFFGYSLVLYHASARSRQGRGIRLLC
jgi:hypothetical protein